MERAERSRAPIKKTADFLVTQVITEPVIGFARHIITQMFVIIHLFRIRGVQERVVTVAVSASLPAPDQLFCRRRDNSDLCSVQEPSGNPVSFLNLTVTRHGSNRSAVTSGVSGSCLCASLLEDQVIAPVFLPALLVIRRAERLFLTVADRLDPLTAHPLLHQRILQGVSSTSSQGKVVLF